MNQNSVMISSSAQQKTCTGRSLESRSVTSASSGQSSTIAAVYHLSGTEDAVTTECVRKSPARALHVNHLEASIARQGRLHDNHRAHDLLAKESDRTHDQLQIDTRIKQSTPMSGKKSSSRSHRRLTPNGENEMHQRKSTRRSTRRVSQNLCPNQQQSHSSQLLDERDEADEYLRKIERFGGSLPFANTIDDVAQLSSCKSSKKLQRGDYSRDNTKSPVALERNLVSPPPRPYDSAMVYRKEDEELRRNRIPKRNPNSSSSTIKPLLDQAEDDVRRKYGVVSASKRIVAPNTRQGDAFRQQEIEVSSNGDELSLPPDQVRSFAHQLLDQLSNMEDDALVKGNASNLDKTRVLQARGERSPIDSNIPSPPLFRRETRLRTITTRVTKENSRAIPGTLLPGAYRAGNWETETAEDDCSMTNSERLMHLSDSERQREEERDIEMARNQLLSSQSQYFSQESRDDPGSQELGRERSAFVEEEPPQEQADAYIDAEKGNSAAFRRRIFCATMVLVIGATVGVVLGLMRHNKSEASEPQANGDSYHCLYDLNLAEQCNSNGHISSVPNCVYNRYRLMEKELGLSIAGSIESCSSSNLALLSMAALNQPLYLSNYVLSSLFFATSGPTSWAKITNWATSSSVCDWEGVTCRLRCQGDDSSNEKCDKDPVQVIGISLNNNGLHGQLPSELGLLSTLETVTFASNSLEGELPIELGSLASLDYLDLGLNNISGTIPTTFASLTNLREFRVMSAQLSGPIPSEVGLMTSLVVLDLSSNRLTGRLPSEVGNLASLENLKIGQNALSGEIPTQLSECLHLEILLAFNNGFTGTIPSQLGLLASLSKYNRHEFVARASSNDFSQVSCP